MIDELFCFFSKIGSIVSPTGSGLQISTEEGVTALNEAIDLLKKFPSLPKLSIKILF